MASKTASTNALITTKASEAALNVQLHPLVLLTISDYITRHTSRQQQGPMVGAIIGQQSGRNFTLEHAYECKTESQDAGVVLEADWFEERLEQYKDVHKAPALDLVGVFMLGPVEGPSEVHLQFVKQVQKLTSTDSLMLLLFHPEQVDQLQGGKLPISLYESVKEQEGGDGEVKFRELSFEVETGEAEMISVDSIATGAGVATAVPKSDVAAQSQGAESSSKDKKSKGKGKAKEDDATASNGTPSNFLSPEDEELIASLTAKVNAIKMLQQRLNLIRAYLQTQPPSYLVDAASTEVPTGSTNHTLLRSINAMLARLPLLAPPSTAAVVPTTVQGTAIPALTAADKEKQDVHLTALLSSLTRSLSEAQAMGSKFNIVARERQSKERGPFGSGGGGGGGAGRGGNKLGFGDESALLSADSGGF